jgi:hypothetical protein
MRTAEYAKRNQQKCKHCDRIVGCDYHGRKHKCGCEKEKRLQGESIDGKYYCESCSRLRADIIWRDDTEQYECQECYQWYLDHN